MATISLEKDFLDLEGKILYSEKECCIQKSNGALSETNGQLVTVMVPTPEKKQDLKSVCIKSLLVEVPGDEAMKYDKYLLLQKFQAAKTEIELESSEIELLKSVIKKCFEVLIMGQAWDMLEGK